MEDRQSREKRNDGIDLLRLILMYAICVLHVSGSGGVINALDRGTTGYAVYWFLRITCFCAVDSFALISGYMAKNQKPRYEKIVNMWFQAFFYSFVMTALFMAVGATPFRAKALVKRAFPVTYQTFWYFSAYFALFFAMPLLNQYLFSITESTAKKALLILVGLYSVLGTIADPFESNKGYSALWLMVLYCIGALARRVRLFESKKTSVLALCWAVSTVVTWALTVFAGIARIRYYVSPMILMNGLLLVLIFSRLNVREKARRWIGRLSGLTFGIYLFHTSPALWEIALKDRFKGIASMNLAAGFILVLLFSGAFFMAGIAVEALRRKLADALRIPKLSSQVVRHAGKLADRLILLMK